MTVKPSTKLASEWARSFEPLLGPNPRVLILGSLPGRASLAARQYYAHPRNLFWRFLAEILGFSETLTYEQRCQQLITHRIAVWDVYAAAARTGSLDRAIQPTEAQLNDFPGLLRQHPTIERVLCNGTLAHQQLTRAWRSALASQLQLIPLPSTSPANASQSARDKLERWRAALH